MSAVTERYKAKKELTPEKLKSDIIKSSLKTEQKKSL